MVVGFAGCGSLQAQSPLLMIGEPMWRVDSGVCNFTLAAETKVINQGPSDYLSGSMRLSLVMTPNPFPDPGTVVSTADIGQLQGGYEFSDFSISAPVAIPPATGYRYFTLVIEEFTGSGWFTHFGGHSYVLYLIQGVVSSPPLWKPPTGRVIPLPVAKPAGMKVVFSQKAFEFGGKAKIVPKIDQYSISAQLNRSGRTVAYYGANPKGSGADWSYKGAKAKWHGKDCRVGRLVIDYGVVEGTKGRTTYWLFFQKNGRGFYKATNVTGKDSVTSWGTFTLG